jgi:DNA primase
MIRQKAKSVLSKAFGPSTVSRDGINVAVSCPECDANKTKKKLSVRLDDYRFHCWVCGIKGKNVWKYISRKFPHVQIDEVLFSKPKIIFSDEPEEAIEEIELPSGFVPVFRKSRDPDVKAVKKYLEKRGITNSDILRWRILTTTTGQYRRRAIIPSFDAEGKLNYFVGRSIDQGTIKYLNAKVSKSEIVFNEIDIDWTQPVVLVEGVFDAIKSVANTIPILGSTLPQSSSLYKQLMRMQSDVIISLDPDLKSKALKIAKSLAQAGCQVRVCFTKEGIDMGDSSKEENKKMLSNAKIFTPYYHLTHKINSIRSGSII